MSSIKWTDQVKVIFSDVDETIADLYVAAVPEMIAELIALLEEGKAIVFITGQGLKSVQFRIIDLIPQSLRKNILVGHCSGAEVWGHDEQGNLREKPYYSVYEEQMNEDQKKKWREIVAQIISEFKLQTFPTKPVKQFIAEHGSDPLTVMMEDRGPQITFEVVNGYDLSVEQEKALEVSVPQTHGAYDLRIPILGRADQLFIEAGLPITSRLGGEFAVDFAVKNVSKTTAVKFVLENEEILHSVGLSKEVVSHPKAIEIWGDKFSTIRGGTDRHMSEATSPQVRSIDFRQENPEEFMPGYNIVVWDGEKHLHEGTLEYLKGK